MSRFLTSIPAASVGYRAARHWAARHWAARDWAARDWPTVLAT